jgi:gliding motility-associated lipoprotein GldH
MNRRTFIFILPFVLSVFLIFSCDPHRLYEKNIRIPDGIWIRNKPVRFEVVVEDTTAPHNLYINVRNTGMYPFSNLYIFVTTIAPSGHTIKDTVQIILSDEKGKWLGDGLGDIWDNQRLYKERVRFAQKGRYIFEYEQAMRLEKLPFILDVGLRVEKAY